MIVQDSLNSLHLPVTSLLMEIFVDKAVSELTYYGKVNSSDHDHGEDFQSMLLGGREACK